MLDVDTTMKGLAFLTIYTISIRHLRTLCTDVGRFMYRSLTQQCAGVHGEMYGLKTGWRTDMRTPVDR